MGWGATLFFVSTALLLSTCTAGLAAGPLLPRSADAELLGQRQTPWDEVAVLMAFLIPLCVVFWRAAWVANGSRKGVERRFLSPAMGWFVALVFGVPSAAAVVFAVLAGDTSAAELSMAASGVLLFGSAPFFARRLAEKGAPSA